VSAGTDRHAATGEVSSFDVSLESQTVLVTGPIEYDALLEKIKKTGKEVRRAPDVRGISGLIEPRQVRSGETLPAA
jgi:hypothetical protein